MIRILVADDQRLFAESLKTVLEGNCPDFSVCAIASDGEEASALVPVHQPDLILMDVRMPIMDGVAATRIIHASWPQIPILMLTTFEDDKYVREALAHGAKGYLLKNIPSAELVASIRAILAGALLIDPRVISALVGGGATAAQDARQRTEAPPEWLDALSRKERQILGLMVGGYQNDEIARQLNMASQTVRNYISRIYDKTGANDRIQAIRMARATGLF